jgi:hypothetical protein
MVPGMCVTSGVCVASGVYVVHVVSVVVVGPDLQCTCFGETSKIVPVSRKVANIVTMAVVRGYLHVRGEIINTDDLGHSMVNRDMDQCRNW